MSCDYPHPIRIRTFAQSEIRFFVTFLVVQGSLDPKSNIMQNLILKQFDGEKLHPLKF